MQGLVILLFFGAGILLWIGAMSWDKDRIRSYVTDRGGRIVSISWSPFGRGWFGEKSDRIYEVVYYDAEGRQHFATCKTSLFTGVYWTEDRVSHDAAGWYDGLGRENEAGNPWIRQLPTELPATDDAEELRRLRAENARLREELRRGSGE